MKIKWLSHSSFKITGSRVIYVDPWKVKGNAPADLILVTHPHYDHFSPDDIEKLCNENTVVIGPVEVTGKLKMKTKTSSVGTCENVSGVKIEAFPSYNTSKQFHPKSNGWLSYLITMDGIKIFHTGDSDLIEEFKGIKADVLLIPVSGTYVMDAEEAAKAADEMKPRIAIPMHFGDIVGSEGDAKKFASLTKTKVRILKQGESFEFKKD